MISTFIILFSLLSVILLFICFVRASDLATAKQTPWYSFAKLTRYFLSCNVYAGGMSA